jgi:hypothetical protein
MNKTSTVLKKSTIRTGLYKSNALEPLVNHVLKLTASSNFIIFGASQSLRRPEYSSSQRRVSMILLIVMMLA